MTERHCGNCAFYDKWTGRTGRCRKCPPALHKGQAIWPTVQAADWCGGHVFAYEKEVRGDAA